MSYAPTRVSWGRVAETAASTAAAASAAAAASTVGSTLTLPAAPTEFQHLLPKLTAAAAHDNLRRSLLAMGKAEASVFLWFAEIEWQGFYRDLGFSSMQAYASEKLNFSANRIRRYRHLIGELERLPRIRAALRAGTIGWTKARAIVKVSSPANEEHWLDVATGLGRRELEERVTRARQQATAKRRGNPRQPDLTAQSGRPVEKAAAPESEPGSKPGPAPASDPASRPEQEQGPASASPSPDEADGNQGREADEAPVFRPPADALNEALIDDGPISVTYRFTPVALARHEAQMETIRKQRLIPSGASREEILALGLEALIRAGRAEPEDAATCEPAGELDAVPAAKTGPEEGRVPRGTPATPYQVVIYKCDICRAAMVQTGRGPQTVSRTQLEAAECDAVVVKEGKRNRSTIPPRVRREVLARARGRCQAPGCRNTHFQELHHIIPRAKGGTNDPKNLIVLCSRCHALWHRKNLDAQLLRIRRE